jgi:hypothetical protein
MVFVLLRRHEQLNGLMEQLGSGTGTEVVLEGKFKGRSHPLFREQAAAIANWTKDTQRLKRWQKILVPRMQTSLLERIQKNPPAWADKQLVKRELAQRKQTVF